MSNYIERYWRDATPADAIKEPPMVARFRNDRTWTDAKELIGFRKSVDNSNLWYSRCVGVWLFCQVYDAPDPGEGWRLIDIEKDDYRQDGVEYWNKERQEWVERLACKRTPFQSLIYYRIRTTPTVTYVPFTWEDREQLRGRWIERDSIEFQVNDVRNENGLYANRIDADSLCKYWKFLYTGRPVGKEVTQ